MVAQAVRQLQVLVVRHPALDSPHLLEGLGEAGEKGLQAGVLQGGDIQEAAGQLDVVVGQVLVGGGHLVGLDVGNCNNNKIREAFSLRFSYRFWQKLLKNCSKYGHKIYQKGKKEPFLRSIYLKQKLFSKIQ